MSLSSQMLDRFIEFAASIINISRKASKSSVCQHILKQLIRSSTSAGANYQESRSAESRADFRHKMQISLKELQESYYWLRLIKRANVLTVNDVTLDLIAQENLELIKIISKAIKTSKDNANYI